MTGIYTCTDQIIRESLQADSEENYTAPPFSQARSHQLDANLH